MPKLSTTMEVMESIESTSDVNESSCFREMKVMRTVWHQPCVVVHPCPLGLELIRRKGEQVEGGIQNHFQVETGHANNKTENIPPGIRRSGRVPKGIGWVMLRVLHFSGAASTTYSILDVGTLPSMLTDSTQKHFTQRHDTTTMESKDKR